MTDKRKSTQDKRPVKFIVSMTLGETCFDFYDIGVETVFQDGTSVWAEPQKKESYSNFAKELGYDDDTMLMCIEHELSHTLLSVMMGLPYSKTMWGIAHKDFSSTWREEEALVLSFQKYCRANNLRVEDIAWNYTKDF